jgi:hypothetical protein
LQDSDGTWGLYDTDAVKRLSFWGYTTGACQDPCPSSIAAGPVCPLPPPPAPSSPTATPLSGTSVQVGWLDNSITESGFEISNGTTTRSVGVNVTGYTWTGLAQGSTTCFKVRAVNSAGPSAWTTNACATTPTIPAAPTNQAAIVLSGTTIRLTWADRSNNETGFEVTNGVTTVNVAPNSTGYSWGGLAMGTYMCLAVRAVNLAGKSAQTPWACDTTPTLPATPTGQAATPVNGTSMKVTWTDRSNNETGFQVTNGVTTAMVPPNTTSYTWTGLTMGSYTCFAIKAVNLAGESPQTPWACNYTPRIPTPPSGPYATPVNLSSIKINWVDMSNNETSFEINNGTTTKTVGANVTSYTWTGLASHTSMCFRVRAVNLAGASIWTIYACATTL